MDTKPILASKTRSQFSLVLHQKLAQCKDPGAILFYSWPPLWSQFHAPLFSDIAVSLPKTFLGLTQYHIII